MARQVQLLCINNINNLFNCFLNYYFYFNMNVINESYFKQQKFRNFMKLKNGTKN